MNINWTALRAMRASSVLLLTIMQANCHADAQTPQALQKQDFAPSDQAIVNAFSALKRFDPQGSPVRAASEDWITASALTKSDPEWRAWVTAKQNSLDKWIALPRDRADFVAGHGFKMLDPVTKIPVQWTPDMMPPRKDVRGGEDFWGAWVFWNRLHNLSRIQEAARLYRLTSNGKYRDWAIQQLDFYAANYTSWPLQTWNGKARMLSQSLDEATALVTLIDAIRLLTAEVDSKHRLSWQTKLIEPIVSNLLEFNQGVNNIAVWHACAVAMAALEYGDAALWERAVSGPNGLNALLGKGVTADYLWYEGAFSYNQYVVSAMTPLFIQAGIKGKIELLKSPMLIAQNMLLSPLQFRFDDGFLPTVGDTRGRSRAIDLGSYLSVVRVLPTTIGILEAQRIKNWDTLIDPLEKTVFSPVRLPPVATKLFEPSRSAILKNETWQVFIHYGQLTQHHAQAEVPGYELYSGSTPIAVDQGTVNYASPWHEQYFRRAVAHNVPLIDGEGQELDKGIWLAGQLDRFDAKQPAISVSQPAYRKDVAVTRQIKLQDGAFVDTTHVKLSVPKDKRRLGMVFNTDCQLDLESSNIALQKTTALPRGTGFSYWTEVQTGSAPAQWTANLLCGNENFAVVLNLGIPHQVFRASVPATPLPKRRNALYLEVNAQMANFEITISPRGQQ